MKVVSTWGMLSLAICVAAQSATAQEVTIEPSKDTTLFESAGGTLSGGANLGLYVGRTLALNGFKLKRGLVAFDIAGSVPAGSSVTSVTLQMNAIKTGDLPAYSVSLHRALADWGEGTVGGNGGGGSAANAGDATWTQSFSGTTNWAGMA